MPSKSAAVKKAKTIVKAPANKNTKKPVAKVVAKAPAKKAVAAKKPVAKKAVAPAKKIAAKSTAKSAIKPVAKKAVPTKKAPLKAAAPTKKAPAQKMPAKTAQKTTKKAVAKAPVKTTAKAAAAKTSPKKKDVSIEEAVARVMRVVGKDKPDAAVKATATPAIAKVTKADKAVKPAKNDNVFDYKAGDMVVYPAHGVGQVEGVENLSIGGLDVTLYTITFAKDRMRLKLPLQKVKTSGLRPLSTKDQMQTAMQTMRGRARIKRVMWSRR
ncbi:MAG TPA: CarD family transcriptional regulator, partial [Alphaproteobacteria bacterium]